MNHALKGYPATITQGDEEGVRLANRFREKLYLFLHDFAEGIAVEEDLENLSTAKEAFFNWMKCVFSEKKGGGHLSLEDYCVFFGDQLQDLLVFSHQHLAKDPNRAEEDLNEAITILEEMFYHWMRKAFPEDPFVAARLTDIQVSLKLIKSAKESTS